MRVITRVPAIDRHNALPCSVSETVESIRASAVQLELLVVHESGSSAPMWMIGTAQYGSTTGPPDGSILVGLLLVGVVGAALAGAVMLAVAKAKDRVSFEVNVFNFK